MGGAGNRGCDDAWELSPGEGCEANTGLQPDFGGIHVGKHMKYAHSVSLQGLCIQESPPQQKRRSDAENPKGQDGVRSTRAYSYASRKGIEGKGKEISYT